MHNEIPPASCSQSLVTVCCIDDMCKKESSELSGLFPKIDLCMYGGP